MASSALDIIKGALKLINVYQSGDTLNAEDSSDGLKALNGIVKSWNNQRLMLYCVKNVVGTLNANQTSHTIGDGGDIDINRPIKIEKAFIRVPGLTNPIDYQLTQDDNNRYQEYSVKYTKVNYPTNFYYEPSFPLASIYLYPIQSMTLELHLSAWLQLPEFESLIGEVTLPINYENALKYKLALDIGPMYGRSAVVAKGTPIYDRCAEFIKEIKAVNQPKFVSTIDSAILGKTYGNRMFNILRGF